MKKRTLALLMALALVAGTMGCGGDKGGNDGNNGKDPETGNGTTKEAPDYLNTDSQFPNVKEGTDIT